MEPLLLPAGRHAQIWNSQEQMGTEDTAHRAGWAGGSLRRRASASACKSAEQVTLRQAHSTHSGWTVGASASALAGRPADHVSHAATCRHEGSTRACVLTSMNEEHCEPATLIDAWSPSSTCRITLSQLVTLQ